MKDTKFYIILSTLFSLIVVALYILIFVSFKTNDKNSINSNLLIKLSKIECDVNSFSFKKEIAKAEVVVIKKEVVKPTYITKKVKDKDDKSVLITSSEVKSSLKSEKEKLSAFEKLKDEFAKTNDYKVALKISRLFYASKRYKKAIKWSMIANELNKKDDGSWILFAKAKLKLGDKKVAKMALKSYQKVYNSKRIKKLLNRISS